MDQKTAEEGWKALSFQSEASHNLENLATIERTLRMGAVEPSYALDFGQRLLSHVHPATQNYFEQLKAKLGDADDQGFLLRAEHAYRNFRFHYRYEKLSEAQRQQYYAPDGHVFVPNKESNKLIVLLATMFNSFFFSNAAMARMLSKLNCNILILKDSTLACHLLGVRNFAIGFDALGPAIEQFAKNHRCDEIFVSGYSSSGYAALRLSAETWCDGCLAFSTDTGFSEKRKIGKSEARDHLALFDSYIDPSLVADLRPLIENADTSIQRTLYYGEKHRDDRKQAMNLAGLEGIELIEVKGIGHPTPFKLMAERKLLPAFAKLVGFKPQS